MTYIYRTHKPSHNEYDFKHQDKRGTELKKLNMIISSTLSNLNQDTPFFKVLCEPDIKKSVISYLDAAGSIRNNFQTLVVIAMGGAALNPKSLLSLVDSGITYSKSPQIYFLDTTDPLYFRSLISKIDLKTTHFLTISNSGNTLETLTLLKCVVELYKNSQIQNYCSHFSCITGNTQNKLHSLALEQGFHIYHHEKEISGRYATFSNVTSFIGIIAGIDMQSFFEAGSEIMLNLRRQNSESIPAQSALDIYFYQKPLSVNMSYIRKLDPFLLWYSQLIAESLGKNDSAITPIRGLGPEDQHTMLQLYLDGPKDKIYTFFRLSPSSSHFIKTSPTETELLNTNEACFHTTLNSILDHNSVVREIILEDLSAKTAGMISAHILIEVVLLGLLMEINPFDQPAVERVKMSSIKTKDT